MAWVWVKVDDVKLPFQYKYIFLARSQQSLLFYLSEQTNCNNEGEEKNDVGVILYLSNDFNTISVSTKDHTLIG